MIRAADLFAGAGGTSTGLYQACHSLGQEVDLLAINHWPVAIETHRANHPGARHICARLESILPEDVAPSRHLNILVASPECTHHSNARGGRPVCDQMRASAWIIPRWLETLTVENVLIENVQEFRNWGPINAKGKPIKRRMGETYRAFLAALRSFGYQVDDRVLNAADYGDATTRRRLFILARRGTKKIGWPEASHGIFGKPYRAAREIIDWSIGGRNIFERKKPLRPNTMRRILAGIKKFGGESFIVHLRGSEEDQIWASAQSVGKPLRALTAGGTHVALCEPFLVSYRGNHRGKNDADARSYSLNKPLPTLDTSNRYALCEPFVIGQQSCAAPRSVDDPLPTIATAGAISLIEPFLVKYYGTGGAKSINEPLDTVTARDRFGLVEIQGKYSIDIRFRMLQPHELAAAMSFEDYKFSGNKGDIVKQIGNAVPVRLARALCTELLKEDR